MPPAFSWSLRSKSLDKRVFVWKFSLFPAFPAQEKAGQLQLEELTGRMDGTGVAGEAQAAHGGGQGGVFEDGAGRLNQSGASFQTISPSIMVSVQTPVSIWPAKGVARPRVRNCAGSTR